MKRVNLLTLMVIVLTLTNSVLVAVLAGQPGPPGPEGPRGTAGAPGDSPTPETIAEAVRRVADEEFLKLLMVRLGPTLESQEARIAQCNREMQGLDGRLGRMAGRLDGFATWDAVAALVKKPIGWETMLSRLGDLSSLDDAAWKALLTAGRKSATTGTGTQR